MDLSYFRIDCDDLTPSGIYEELAFDYEELVQLNDGTYLDRSLWDRGYMSHDPDNKPALRTSQRSLKNLTAGNAIMPLKSPKNLLEPTEN